jgi:hypothetical protein
LSGVPVEAVLAFITNPEQTLIVNTEGLWINEVDFTQYIKGVFNKEDVIQHLKENYGFRKEQHKITDENEKQATILDNDSQVGLNCLSFITTDLWGQTRYKLYDKFIQSVESRAVRSEVGSHLVHWVNNPEPPLQEAIPKSLDTGLLRLESTFYREPQNQTLAEEHVNKAMEHLRKVVLPPNLLFYNSIQHQFNLRCSALHWMSR